MTNYPNVLAGGTGSWRLSALHGELVFEFWSSSKDGHPLSYLLLRNTEEQQAFMNYLLKEQENARQEQPSTSSQLE